jgi:hypothetical protein
MRSSMGGRRPSGRKARIAKPGERMSLGLKVTAEIKNRLDFAAKTNGRTQSQEAEARLEASFRDEARAPLFHDAVYGVQTAGLLELLGAVIRNTAAASVGLERAEDWLSQPPAFGAVAAAVNEIVAASRPLDTTAKPADDDDRRGRAIAHNWLTLIAARHPKETTEPLAKFGMAIRAKFGDAAASRIGAFLASAPSTYNSEEAQP